MVEQTALLRALCKADGALTIDELVQRMKARGPRARKHVLDRLAKLMQRKFAERANFRPHGINCPPSLPSYQATKEGRDFIAAGGKIKSGNQGHINGVWRKDNQPKYAKLWTALRMQPNKRAALQHLNELAGLDADGQGAKYFKALAAAGLVIRLRDREPGFAPTSNGFIRYAIVKDVGPLAPLMRRGGLINPNNHNELIAYAAKKEAA